MRLLIAVLAACLWLPAALRAESPCGPGAPCAVAGGSYHLLFPEGWDGASPLPALVYFHGHRSSGASVFRGGSLKSVFAAAGYLVIAPNGQPMGSGSGFRWPARPAAGAARDDVAFTRAVLDDALARVPQIDPARIHAAGFSAGGSMAWMLACYAADRVSAVVSVAGALRRPIPAPACPSGPLRLLHIHGFADTQVPLEGRGIGQWHQGDVFESLALARTTNACRSNPDRILRSGGFACRQWDASCGAGALALCLHEGGHGLPRGWAELARDWVEGRGPAN